MNKKQKEENHLLETSINKPIKKINWIIALLLINLITSCSIYSKEDQSYYKRENISREISDLDSDISRLDSDLENIENKINEINRKLTK